MSAPCGGCPPCCKRCVFAAAPKPAPTTSALIVDEATYGCVHGGKVVHDGGTIGLLRAEGFHPVTPEGSAFLRNSQNPLAVHL